MNDLDLLVSCVKKWSRDRGLHDKDPRIQFVKLQEELGELANGLLKDKPEQIVDSIGDAMVVLIIMCQQLGLELVDCLQYSYNEIKPRGGKMINGVFVKESDLNDK